MDTTRDILYRGYYLNLSTIAAGALPDGIGQGLSGCVVDDFDPDDVDVVQFMEKRAEADGMDAGNPFLGGRRIRMSGTVYGKSRALAYDEQLNLRAALNPILAQREIPDDHGFLPLYFSVPTNDTANFPSGARSLRAMVMPKAFHCPINRDEHGGADSDQLAFNWSAVFVMRDPQFEGETAQDYVFADTAVTTGATAAASTDLVTKTAHGLVAGDRIYFTTLTGGTGLSKNTTYYVIATGLTANDFKVSTTSGGAAVDITVNYTDVAFAKFTTYTGNLVNRGTYVSPLNMLFLVGSQAGTITVTAGGSVFTIAIPASSDVPTSGATATASTDLINKTAHGLLAGDPVYFTTLTGGTGLALTQVYYVLATGLTANAFAVATTPTGTAVNITADYSAVAYSKVGTRIIRVKRDKTITVEENGVEALKRSWLTFSQATTWPLIAAGTSAYTVTVNGAVLLGGGANHQWFWEMYA